MDLRFPLAVQEEYDDPSMSIDPRHLGPLPRMDSNARLQEQSLAAFRALLKDSPLLVRDERILDYGVDLSLEAVVGGHPTNFRSQVQVKAVTSLRPNTDGTRSKSVDTSNLNYLLNGTTPLYVLYIADEDAFFVVFAADARRELDKGSPGWMSQNTVTLHFRDRLHAECLNAVYERILKEASWRREMHDRLGAATSSEAVSIVIDPGTLQTCDADEAYRILTGNGLTIVTNGLAGNALRLIDLLDLSRKLTPRIQLIGAYAWYSLGRPQQALASTGEAMARLHELTLADQQILLDIRDASECMTGRITREEFVERRSQDTDATTGVCRDSDEVDRLRFAFLGERDQAKSYAILRELQAAVGRVLGAPGYSAPYRLQARTFLAYCEGCYRSRTIARTLTMLRVCSRLGLPWARSITCAVAESMQEYDAWEQHMQSLVDEAGRMGIPLLRAEVLRIRLVVRMFALWNQRFASRFLQIGEAPKADVLHGLRNEALAVVVDFEQAGHLNGQLRTKMHLADLSELEDRTDVAKQIAAEVLPTAKALRMEDIVAVAEGHLSGGSPLKRAEDGMQAERDIDPDTRDAALTDAELDAYAGFLLQASGLPADRQVPVRVEVGSMRYIAQQRLRWCGAIKLIQDLDHMRHLGTAYRRVPTYFGKCTKHGFESVQGSSDYMGTIDRFKARFCSGCDQRSPKHP